MQYSRGSMKRMRCRGVGWTQSVNSIGWCWCALLISSTVKSTVVIVWNIRFVYCPVCFVRSFGRCYAWNPPMFIMMVNFSTRSLHFCSWNDAELYRFDGSFFSTRQRFSALQTEIEKDIHLHTYTRTNDGEWEFIKCKSRLHKHLIEWYTLDTFQFHLLPRLSLTLLFVCLFMCRI